jgi:ABC-type iron transport system FetAB ATPase subunit
MLTDADPDRDAVRHILTTSAIAHRTASHLLDTDFDFDGLRREAATMSGGEALLVRIAYELWNAEKVTGLWELPRRLDDSCFRRVLEGLTISRGRAFAGLRRDGLDELAA